jgi:hypothetical protein
LWPLRCGLLTGKLAASPPIHQEIAMTLLKNVHSALGALVVAGLAACGGGGDGAASTPQTGSLRLALTDAPACGYDAVHVTIEKLRVHQSSSASASDSGWSDIVLNPARRVNLLNLTNGVLDELGQIPLPTGRYSQLRLVLGANDAAHPLRNSVQPTGGAEVALKTPSGQQSGVKTNITIDIAANQMADFVIDFDACKSVVAAGGSGQYLLKPVVSVIPRYISGVAGFVDASLIAGSTSVSVQQNGALIKATVPDSSGKFLLQPVAPGSYTLVLTAPGRSTSVVTGVAVSSATVTTLNTAGSALNPPSSASGSVSGSAPPETFVRVQQLLGSGLNVQLAGQFVNGVTGSYSYQLPVNAPFVAPYVPAPAPLVFVADTAAAGHYTLSASLSGFIDKLITLPLLTAGASIVAPISFP